MITQFTKRFHALITPKRWPMPLRRLFVVLFPISIPVLVLLWAAGIAVMFIALCVWCMAQVVLELGYSLRDLWGE